ncbi:MAG: hypothetical protein JW797_10520 [Bradymonadales bacterium]|nr:hypothetical protein [Bradymonadales bacterium]
MSPLARSLFCVLLLLSSSISCYQPPEPSPPRWARQRAGSHLIRVLGQTDQDLLATLRVERRSATLQDSRGVRLGRAKSVQDRIFVTDRRARPVLIFRPDQSDSSPEGRPVHSIWIENPEGRPLGWLELTGDDRLLLFEADGEQIAMVSTPVGTDWGDVAEVRCLEEGEPDYRVTRSHRGMLTVVGGPQEAVIRWLGSILRAWIVAAVYLPQPSELEEAQGDLFQLGLFFSLMECRRTGSCPWE